MSASSYTVKTRNHRINDCVNKSLQDILGDSDSPKEQQNDEVQWIEDVWVPVFNGWLISIVYSMIIVFLMRWIADALAWACVAIFYVAFNLCKHDLNIASKNVFFSDIFR